MKENKELKESEVDKQTGRKAWGKVKQGRRKGGALGPQI